MKRALFVPVLLLVVLVNIPAHVGYSTTAAEQRFTVIVSPEMELLAGVLSHSVWIGERGPSGQGNEYFRALNGFFAPYKDHEAIRLANELTRSRFVYDAPPSFICHLGPLPDLELRYEYSDLLVRRAGGRDRLEEFRVALRDLARESNFLDFFAEWEPRFAEWVSGRSFNGDRVVAWLEDFFGTKASEFYLILAPAMFPGGGYGPTINLPNGEIISYQIIRERGNSTTEPDFPSGRDLESLSLHEWGHSFVNPALDQHPSRIQDLNHLFTPVRGPMESQAYSNVVSFTYEQVLRGVTALAASDFYGAAALDEAIAGEESRSFYLTTEVIEMLEVYRDNRDTYPTFADFVPELLDSLEVARVKPPVWHRYVSQLLVVVAIVAMVYVVKTKRVLQND